MSYGTLLFIYVSESMRYHSCKILQETTVRDSKISALLIVWVHIVLSSPAFYNPINTSVPKKVLFTFKTICQFLIKCLNLLFCVVRFLSQCYQVSLLRGGKLKLIQGDGSHLRLFQRAPRGFHHFLVF